MASNTMAAFAASPKPPVLLGSTPISWGGTRLAASWSSRVTFLMVRNSSLAATSDTGINCTPSFLPFGA
ncbi:hypothetical protein D3C80_1894060 [compost metagenome]